MTAFLAAASRFTPLSENSQQALMGIVKCYQWPKGRILIKANTVAERLYYLEQGLARTYYHKEEKDVTDWISTEGEFVGSIVSYLIQQPDRRIVELLEPSLVWTIPYGGLERLYHHHHEIERLGRLLVSHGLVLMQQRFDDLHFATAQQRYQKLLATHPSLIQRVPLSMIASYLGITQETLSRIRSQR